MNAILEPTLPVAVIEIIFGLVMLSYAADKFVDGAAAVARVARISPVVVGAVIVGFGTSVPELLVSGIAASNGDLDLGVGNVVGSNVANLSLVLGTAAFIVPILATKSVVAKEVPLSLGATVLFAIFTIGGLQRWEGIVMLVTLAAMLTWTVMGSRAEDVVTDSDDEDDDESSVVVNLGITLIGLLGTVLGAQALVTGATTVADEAGLTGGFVGFTLVALGTSLPELVTAIVAARKGETDLIMGNLLGSNIFNSLAVGGAISVLGAGPIDDASIRTIGIISMVAVGTVATVFIITRRRLHRVEAIVLLAIWLGTIALLAQNAKVDEQASVEQPAQVSSGHRL